MLRWQKLLRLNFAISSLSLIPLKGFSFFFWIVNIYWKVLWFSAEHFFLDIIFDEFDKGYKPDSVPVLNKPTGYVFSRDKNQMTPKVI